MATRSNVDRPVTRQMLTAQPPPPPPHTHTHHRGGVEGGRESRAGLENAKEQLKVPGWYSDSVTDGRAADRTN